MCSLISHIHTYHVHFGCHCCDVREVGVSLRLLTRPHARTHQTSRCHHYHYYNIGSVLFHDVASYTSSLLSRIHTYHVHFGCHGHDIREVGVSMRLLMKPHTHTHQKPRCHHYHYHNIGSVLFHNVTCYTSSLLSCIHTYDVHFGCHSVILERLKCQ